MEDCDYEEERVAASGRLKSLERLEALYRLREEADRADRKAMKASIESLIAMERKALARDLDDEPA